MLLKLYLIFSGTEVHGQFEWLTGDKQPKEDLTAGDSNKAATSETDTASEGEALAGGPPEGEALAGGPPEGEAFAGGSPEGEALAGGPPEGEALAGGPPEGEALASGPPEGEALAEAPTEAPVTNPYYEPESETDEMPTDAESAEMPTPMNGSKGMEYRSKSVAENEAANCELGQCMGRQTVTKVCTLMTCPTDECIDCVWEDWSEMGACECYGLQERARSIRTANNDCGQPCVGPLIQTFECAPQCEVEQDCLLGPWSDWTECNKSCDSGQTNRQRVLKKSSKNGGAPCNGDTSETKPCNTHSCANGEDCELTEWGEWSACSKSCSGGEQIRSRNIKSTAEPSGNACKSALEECRGCNEVACTNQIDCMWGDYEEWSACSRSCGGGQKNRSRVVLVSPRGGGKLCEPHAMADTAPCNTQSCGHTVDCVLGFWADWGACSCSCNGIRQRQRHIETYPEMGGNGCSDSLKQVEGCNLDKCGEDEESSGGPMNCLLAPFSTWSECSAKCNTGIQTRTRDVARQASVGGLPCEGIIEEVQGCNTQKCGEEMNESMGGKERAVDCEWSPWDPWSPCSASCGGGQKNRVREISQMPENGGEPCGHQNQMEIEPCNTEGCNCQDCVWGSWSSWGSCTCTGLQQRHRSIFRQQRGCGTQCEGPRVSTKVCDPDCAHNHGTNCELTEWSDWGQCSASCGGGQLQRSRDIKTPPKKNGIPCTADLKEVIPCSTYRCGGDVQDCLLSKWSPWSDCTLNCGGGQQTKTRMVIQGAADGGKGCSKVLKKIRGCNEFLCGDVADCKWNQWGEWSACTKSCGGGTKQRDRSIQIAPRNGGKMCDANSISEAVECNVEKCFEACIDGVWGQWSDWHDCSVTCGIGYRSRSRNVQTPSNYCGKALQGQFQVYEKCEQLQCLDSLKVDCDFTPWSDWGDCSCRCSGVKDRFRSPKHYSANGGRACEGALKEVNPCNVGKCSVEESQDCKFGEWTAWTQCSATCDIGSQTHIRGVIQEQKGNGNPCQGELSFIRPCTVAPCHKSTDCKWGQWMPWSACSKECGGGQRNRYRHIMTLPNSNGKQCVANDSAETQGCNTKGCGSPAFCVWGNWDAWSNCSKTCGQGQMWRGRSLTVVSKINDTKDVLAAGIMDQLWNLHLTPDNGEKIVGAFIGGIFVAGMLFSLLHRVRRRRRNTINGSVDFQRLAADTCAGEKE